MDDEELATALAELQENARRPLAKARTLPPALYHLDGVFALECEKIFAREWLCLGRADELPEKGAYRAFELLGEPLFLIRDAGGALRVFSNVCRHRLPRLVTGSGRGQP